MNCTIGLRKLPFTQYDRQVIYTEGNFCELVNHFISKDYKWVKRLFGKYSYDFCYIPKLEEELTESEFLQYFAPSVGNDFIVPKMGNDFILDYMVHPENKAKIKPMLLFHSVDTEVEYPEAENQYQGYILDLPDDLESRSHHEQTRILKKAFEEAAKNISSFVSDAENRIMYRMDDDMVNDALYDADAEFDRDSWQLIEEIRERILKLHQRGIGDEILRRAIHGKEKLSRLIVTTDKRILLPDYDMEIKLRPLPKAVYLLFLRHHEGILFKSLPDYRDELAGIYQELRGGELSDREERSVLDVTSPLSNSINEKCARIREAFLDKFDEHLARYYYVDGRKGEPKRIALPDNLIEWQ